MCLQCYDRLCQWDKMESVCHLLLSDSEAGTPDVELDSVWQQTCNQVLSSVCFGSLLLHNGYSYLLWSFYIFFVSFFFAI